MRKQIKSKERGINMLKRISTKNKRNYRFLLLQCNGYKVKVMGVAFRNVVGSNPEIAYISYNYEARKYVVLGEESALEKVEREILQNKIKTEVYNKKYTEIELGAADQLCQEYIKLDKKHFEAMRTCKEYTHSGRRPLTRP
ncbi:hypothetical protein EHP00_1499 [Ecytonucleospora hepatopenaei]|uniref:Uncharacterized protein n=1 Tax=Ecytonucleospora hepatopenaei TaxID=646526 RepID=A0A1W0E3N9_9MICR|nr:hypothetical protein EHP00_1499 [Ecytonucleospora hepatopenaei]